VMDFEQFFKDLFADWTGGLRALQPSEANIREEARLARQRKLWAQAPTNRHGMTRQMARLILRRRRKEQEQAMRQELRGMKWKDRVKLEQVSK